VQQLVHLAEASRDQRQPLAVFRLERLRPYDRIRIAIDSDDRALRGIEQRA
jgi:hypothetical protein